MFSRECPDGDGGATRKARPYLPVKPLEMICVARATSVEHEEQRSVSGALRDRRRARKLSGTPCLLMGLPAGVVADEELDELAGLTQEADDADDVLDVDRRRKTKSKLESR